MTLAATSSAIALTRVCNVVSPVDPRLLSKVTRRVGLSMAARLVMNSPLSFCTFEVGYTRFVGLSDALAPCPLAASRARGPPSPDTALARDRAWNRRSTVSNRCNASSNCNPASRIGSERGPNCSVCLIANLIRSIATRAWYAISNSIAVGRDCTSASIVSRI